MAQRFSWKEFRPAIFFILKFLAVYLVGNIFYGLFITHFKSAPDPVTVWVTNQVGDILNLITPPVTTLAHSTKPTVLIVQNKPVISVYEGCNGLNVVIVFLAFLVAYGPMTRKLLWFIPVGILVIHVSNLLRVGLLFFVSKNYPHQLYFLHKYFFTAFIYVVVFALWFCWIRISHPKEHAA
jgi:exosortase family protein XrtF